MHHLFKDYQEKILAYNERLKEEYIQELREINHEIILEAYRDQKRREYVCIYNYFCRLDVIINFQAHD